MNQKEDLKKQKISFLMSSDKNYICKVLTNVVSIMEHSNSENIYKLYFMPYKINNKFLKGLFDKLKRHYKNFEYEILDVEKYHQYLYDFDRYSQAAYSRLYISKFDLDTDKILYFDSDITILDDIAKLYSIDITDNYFGACLDHGLLNLVERKTICETIYCNDYKNINFEEYFKNIVKVKDLKKLINSGVLLINLEKWKKENICEQLLELIRNNKFLFPDQDALNTVCQNGIKIVDSKWNFPIVLYEVSENIREKLKECIGKGVAALHYKPWESPDIAFANEYFKNYKIMRNIICNKLFSVLRDKNKYYINFLGFKIKHEVKQ